MATIPDPEEPPAGSQENYSVQRWLQEFERERPWDNVGAVPVPHQTQGSLSHVESRSTGGSEEGNKSDDSG